MTCALVSAIIDDLGAQGLKSLQRWEGEPQQGQNCLPEVVREPVGDAGDRRLITPPTFPGGLEVHLLEHRRVGFHRGELRQSGPQILGDDAVILAVARRGKTLLRDDGGVGDVLGGNGVGSELWKEGWGQPMPSMVKGASVL